MHTGRGWRVCVCVCVCGGGGGGAVIIFFTHLLNLDWRRSFTWKLKSRAQQGAILGSKTERRIYNVGGKEDGGEVRLCV